MSLCEHCARATFNGFPPEGSPEGDVGTIWFWCPTVDTHCQRFFECRCHIEGEPRHFDKRGWEMG